MAFSFATGERRVVVEGVNMARFVPPDTLVYSRAGVLFAARFDASRLEVVGQATPVLEGVAGDPSSGATYFTVANDGTLAVVRGAGSKVSRLLTLVDRKGVATPLPLAARGFRHPRFSPGRHPARLQRGQRGHAESAATATSGCTRSRAEASTG